MTRPLATLLLVLSALVSVPAAVVAQAPLTLAGAMARARDGNPDVRQASARVTRADAASREDRAGLLPRVDVSEGWQRSDLPVFAFSSLLSQRRFTAEDFDLARLNRPEAVDNFRSALVVEQPVFDEMVRAAVTRGDVEREMTGHDRERIVQQAVVATIEAFGRVRLLDAMTVAAAAGVAAAEQDLSRATNRRDAGLATDADVLVVTVHLSATTQRRIQAETEASVARARLNYLMGEPLDAVFTLVADDGPAGEAPAAWSATADDETAAILVRPDVQLAAAAERLAGVDVRAARAAFLPQVVARGAVEWYGGTFGSRQRGWMLGADVRLNVFRGFADRARLAQARATVDERRLDRAAVEDRARLDVRAADAAVASARARLDLSRAAVAAARENQRITRDRYDNGLAAMTDVLRAAQVLLDADAQAVAVETDSITSRARLDAALGRLGP